MTPEEKAAADTKAEADRIAAAQRAEAEARNAEPVVVIGDAKLGGPFNIDGPGLGNSAGSLTIAGQVIKTTSWTDLHIKGTVPAGLKGEVVLTTSSGGATRVWPYVGQNGHRKTTSHLGNKIAQLPEDQDMDTQPATLGSRSDTRD
jgi:hypothetical protein